MKIIGLVLLCIIAFVLFLVLFILFVPIPYSVKATFNGTFKDFKISARLYGIPLPINWFMKRGEKKKDKEKKAQDNEKRKTEIIKETGSHGKTEQASSEKPMIDTKADGNDPTGEKNDKQGLKDKISGIGKSAGSIIGLLKDKENIGIVVKTLKHIRPRKISVNMILGLAEPDQTGLLFGGLGILMMIWPGRYRLSPDFENETVQGKVRIKGILSVILIAIYALKLFKALERSKKDGSKQ